ncbi:MAG: DNA polymerase III subunit alpha [Acidobacteria bacterium]|nr:DNA polymerase III subunit alpha [Acidobacteriota bacterium]
MTFVHLHNHSDYSLLDGASKIDRLVDRAVTCGMPALAITDHGNLFGAIDFYRTAREHGLKPIIGCEVYVAKESRHKKSGGGDQSNHLILLARDNTGYQNLSKLVSLAYIEGFYYKPRVDKELLARYSQGLIALTSCLKGSVPQLILMDQFDAAVEEAHTLRDVFGAGNFYLELQDHGIPGQQRVNPRLLEISSRSGIPVVCTNDTHYLSRDDYEAHDVLLCIGTSKTLQDAERMRYATDQYYFKSAEEMHELWRDVPEAVRNTLEIAERCNLVIETSEALPPFEVPPGFTSDTYFEHVVRAGFAERRRHLEVMAADNRLKNPLEVYEKRLEAEIEMIRRMKFSSYFLIVWDLVKYARDNQIPVGPGRGSVVGSLVAYSLHITDIDPLQYNLFFERFLNPERIVPPDIDMDFCMNRRSEVIEYVARKYGRENVCQIITFGTMAAKGVIRDVGRVLGMPYADVDRIAKLIPNDPDTTIANALVQEQRLSDEIKKNEQAQKLIEIAKRLEGLSRHASIHAAGVVIAPKPLIELIPLYKTAKDEITTQYSMTDLETVGLLKMDFLALTTLTVLDDAVTRVRLEKQVDLDLSSIPLNDPQVYRLFSDGNTNGIFQFESSGMKTELRRLKPERFEDLIALNALYRPGPMHMIPDFIKRKHGLIEVKHLHPLLEEVLKETYGVIVYQEQVMQIASCMAGFSLGEADILRKGMGKKIAEIMQSMRPKFIEGARKNKVPEKTAAQVFDLMEQFGQYGFNKSHSTAYALLAYQTAYLKVHYPVQFMAALLSSEIGKTDKIVSYIAECRDMGIPVLPPDINESDLLFRSVGGAIRFGLLAIRNVGSGAIPSILLFRREKGRFKSLYQFCEEVDSRSVNKRVIESLIRSGAFDSFGWKRSQLMAIADAAIEHGQKYQRDRQSGQRGLFSDLPVGEAATPEPAPPDIPEWPQEQLLAFEKETLGYYVSGHPLDRFAQELSRFSSKKLAELIGEARSCECSVAGIVTDMRTHRTKKKELMGIFTLEDLTATAETLVFPRDYARFEASLKDDMPILVTGRFEFEGESGYRIIASEIQPLQGIAERNARTLHLRIPVSSASPDTALALYRLLERYRGETGVNVELYQPRDFRVTIQSSDFVKVRSSPELIRQIEEICGAGTVQVAD